MIAPKPPDETARLQLLLESEILDTAPEYAFDEVVKLVSQVCDVPIALVCLVDDTRQWFKAVVGLDIRETSRDWAFCAHAILEPGTTLVVPDAKRTCDFRIILSSPAIPISVFTPVFPYSIKMERHWEHFV